MKLFHGTSSGNLSSIQDRGFSSPCYFTTSLEDAEYYAATGGEQSLQDREEEYEEKTGINARERFEPDMWDMFEELYPDGQHPVVICVEIPDHLLTCASEDSGAQGALVFPIDIPSDTIMNVKKVNWPSERISATLRP